MKDRIKIRMNYNIEPGIRFLYFFRKYQYWMEQRPWNRKFIEARYDRLCEYYGIVMPLSVKVGKGFALYHINGIVINAHAQIGDNCSILQQVTLGNTAKVPSKAPKLGNNVQVFAGAKIIGPIQIENGVIIGAGAVVIKDCVPENSVWAGVPAKKINGAADGILNHDYLTFNEWKRTV